MTLYEHIVSLGYGWYNLSKVIEMSRYLYRTYEATRKKDVGRYGFAALQINLFYLTVRPYDDRRRQTA
jgi:hypothetical protein